MCIFFYLVVKYKKKMISRLFNVLAIVIYSYVWYMFLTKYRVNKNKEKCEKVRHERLNVVYAILLGLISYYVIFIIFGCEYKRNERACNDSIHCEWYKKNCIPKHLTQYLKARDKKQK